MLSHALHLRDQQHLSLRDIATRLVIATGKKKGQHPSPATVLRMLRDHDERAAAATTKLDVVDELPATGPALLSLAGSRHTPPVAAVDDLSGLRPIPARIRQDGEPLTAAEVDLRERLVRQRETIRAACCPTCGNEPVEARGRFQQRQDLAIVWLYTDPDQPGAVIEQRHCAGCQPHHHVATIVCPLCGDGPMVAGDLADLMPDPANPPAAVRGWLTGHGWHDATGDGLVCADHSGSGDQEEPL